VSISLATRFAILKRDRFSCVYCGAHPPQVEIEVDHFFPASRGGSDDAGNLVTACLPCNRGKGTMVLENEWPGADSPLWNWINKGAEIERDHIKHMFLDRDDETLAEVVERLWPEADY
jgi:hypothetical protein